MVGVSTVAVDSEGLNLKRHDDLIVADGADLGPL